MDLKMFLALLAVFLVGVSFVSADIDNVDVAITPATPVTSDNLVCSFTVTGTETGYTADVTWEKNSAVFRTEEDLNVQNAQQRTSTVDDSQTSKDETWECTIDVSDGTGDTATASASVTIGNTAPDISSISTSSAMTGSQFTKQVEANDEDGDSLTYSLTVSPSGMTIDNSGEITWTPEDSQTGSHDVTVQVSDGSAFATEDFRVSVSDNKLVITSISAKCSPSCDDDDLDELKAMDGNAGEIKEVNPGATLTLKVKVKNEWPDGTDDHEIDSIELECTLEDIGDDDEIDESVDFEDLDPDDASDKEELSFDISKEGEDDESYEIDCNLVGEDEDGTDYDIDFVVDVKVEKEAHDIVFQKASVSPSSVSCSRNIVVAWDIKNIGAKDEDDVQVSVRNDDLDFFKNEFIEELESGDYDDDDTEYDVSYNFRVEDDAEPGIYAFTFEIDYDDGDEEERMDVEIEVKNCGTEETEPETEEKEESTEVVVVPQPQPTPTQKPIPIIAQPTDKTEDVIFTDSVWFILLLVVAVVVLLSIAIWMLSLVFKK